MALCITQCSIHIVLSANLDFIVKGSPYSWAEAKMKAMWTQSPVW